MVRKSFTYVFLLLLISLSLWGCPKRPPEVIRPEKPFENPIVKILEALSPAESLQSRASIRIETVRNGQEMNFFLNGFVLYERPDKLRVLGFSPFPIAASLFDALYLSGEFYVLIPPQKRAYAGEVSEFEGVIEKAGPIVVSVERPEGSEVPNRIQIHSVEKETRIDLKLKDISINSSLPADAFQWSVPEGVEVLPLAQLLKGKKLR
jgi:outer membrane lipoprotein-sorting protein